MRARGLAVGLVGLVCTYGAVAAGIGAGMHKNYGAPTPVRHFNPSSFVYVVITDVIC